MTEQQKLYRLLKLITMLKTGYGRALESLAGDLICSERTVRRYLKLLDETGFPMDEKIGNPKRFFIVTTHEDEESELQFTLEEARLLKDLVVGGAHHHPLKDGILQKLYINSELEALADNLVNARVSIHMDKLVGAVKKEKQVILKHYHSAHSGEIKYYKVEPFDFTENYNTVLAYDTGDGLNKHFKLERMGEVLALDTGHKYLNKHEKQATDVFGFSGDDPKEVILKMSLRAYLLMREEYPRSIQYLSKDEEGNYIFNGPVYGFNGIGRFVLGLVDEVEVVKPSILMNYLYSKTVGLNTASVNIQGKFDNN